MKKANKLNERVDAAFSLLLERFNENREASDKFLWVCDENNLYEAQPLNTTAQYLTNRFDVYESLKANNIEVTFNDFNFDHITPNSLQAIFYRVSKEKPVVHHVINQAKKYLAIGGAFYIAGLKSEGTKTYLEKTAAFFSNSKSTKKSGTVYWAKFTKLDEKTTGAPEALDDNQYTTLRVITEEPNNPAFFSKPGIFGWQQIDAGSEFLINTLIENKKIDALAPKSLLDLGCGYGYLAITAIQQLFDKTPEIIILTDNNAAALSAANYNCAEQKINSTVIAADAGDKVDNTIEMIICNPPFHQGFTVDNTLTDKFIRAAARLLTQNGQAFFVVNSFIALEKYTRVYFNHCEKINTNGKFSVYRMHEPKRPLHH